MAQHPKTIIASSIALAVGLSGCGGGGTSMASIPPPPAAPTPTPTPTPTAASISAPARAIAPNANLFPQAAADGPTIALHDATTFPLIETVVKINSAGVVADTATMNAGASLTSSYAPDDYQGGGGGAYTIDIENPAIGVSDQPFSMSNSGGRYHYFATVGDKTVTMSIKDPSNSNLSWTTYGMWAVHVDVGAPSTTSAAFVTGYKTPTGSVPTTGSATYLGSVVGQVIYPKAGAENGVGQADLTGSATLEANFASGGITGELTGMMAGSAPWNSVSLLGSIAGGQFSGTSAVTSAPANNGSLSAAATGTFAGMFFGPNAQELGAVWTLYDGTSSAIGSIGAKNDPACGGCWDY
jgi:hypothetical protein